MLMLGKNNRYRGFLLTEIVVSMTILGILVAGLAMSLHGFAKFNRYQLVRQQCIAAAQAEIESIAATGGPIPDEDLARLWSNIAVSVEKSAGTGQWLQMELVEVTAVGKSFRKEVKIQLSRYFPADKPAAEGK
jgi:type II secretory pathway pseudopilin PulG